MARREPVRLPRVRLATARPPRAGLPAAGWEQPRPAKTTGGGGTDPGAMEAAIMEALVLWYDPRRQGATNESMAADPHLRDLSGNGHDATCYNFAWTEESGISTEAYPGALVSDGVDDLCWVEPLEALTDFTVVAERQFGRFNNACLAARGRVFSFESNNSGQSEATLPQAAMSFGATTFIPQREVPAGRAVSWMTPTSYNGMRITRGGGADDGKAPLWLFKRDTSANRLAAVLWSFLLFRRTLTEQEIEWVKEHMMGEP